MEEKKLFIIEKIKIVLLYIYILLYYLFGSDASKLKYSEIVLLVFVGLETFKIIKSHKIKYCIPIVMIFIFVIFAFMSNFWAVDSQLAVEKSKTLFILATFFLVTYNFFISLEEGEGYILKSIMYAGFVLSVYVIMYYGIGEYFSRLVSGQRIGGEINNLNTIGLQTSISFIIAIYYFLKDKKKIYLFLSILPFIISIGTGSKKVIIIIVLGIALLLLLKNNVKFNIKGITKKIFTFVIFTLILIYLFQLPMFSNVVKRFQKMSNTINGERHTDESTEIRELFIKEGIKQFKKNPILGIGIDNSNFITMQASRMSTYLHNNYVELLATVGIIGFSLYYFIYFYMIYYSIKFLRKNNNYICMVLIIFLINLVLEFGFVSYYNKSTYIYFLFGAVVIEKMKRKDKNEEISKSIIKT